MSEDFEFRFVSHKDGVTSEGNLTMVNVQTEDSGKYKCQASNSFGDAYSIVEIVVKGMFTAFYFMCDFFHFIHGNLMFDDFAANLLTYQ